MSLVHEQQRLLCWLQIIAQGSADQGFKRIYYFQSLRLHKKEFGAIVQANVGSIIANFEDIGAVESSKLTFLFLFLI